MLTPRFLKGGKNWRTPPSPTNLGPGTTGPQRPQELRQPVRVNTRVPWRQIGKALKPESLPTHPPALRLTEGGGDSRPMRGVFSQRGFWKLAFWLLSGRGERACEWSWAMWSLLWGKRPFFFLLFYFVLDRVSCSPGRSRTCYVAKDNLEPLILLPLPSE